MRGGPILLLLPFYPLLKKMVMAEVSRWLIYVTIILISIGIPFGVLGLNWYINDELPVRQDIIRMTMCAAVLFVGLNVVLYVADKLSEL